MFLRDMQSKLNDGVTLNKNRLGIYCKILSGELLDSYKDLY